MDEIISIADVSGASEPRRESLRRQPTVVLWDLDGTLADSEPLHEQTLRLSLRLEGIDPPADLHDLVVGTPSSDIHRLFRLRFGLRASFEAWSRFRCRHYLEHAATVQAREEALELYRLLDRHGVRQGIVSNSDRLIVQANLHAIGLAEPNLVTVARNDVRRGKPDPEPYLRAMWLLNAQPEHTVVVEDSPPGARAGVAAGCRTLFWPTLAFAPPPGCEFVESAADAYRRLTQQTEDSAGGCF